MCNIFNTIITKNFPTLEKTMPIQGQEASRTPNRPNQKNDPTTLSLKQQVQRLKKEY
jgi:hypothetical protein